MSALGHKVKQLIYIAIRTSQGETTAVISHISTAKQERATRDELKEAILMTATVCDIKGIASCLIPALEVYDNAK
ncbi:MAG: carboxymuconolactone decarboxylase family protein [Bacteroidales bacterium]|jgi:alkylhydroperoxidase/carboxymuconolactone decarboxylase family protein YurZ|nr:carboxymuconolactone decarboxylase family protein [Bacteroidales bacterium]